MPVSRDNSTPVPPAARLSERLSQSVQRRPWHRAKTTIIDEEEELEEKESLAKAVAITHSEKVTKELHEQFKHLASRESVGKNGVKIRHIVREVPFAVFEAALLNTTENDLQKEAIDEFIREGDTDGDGTIDFMEFVELYQKLTDSPKLQQLGFRFGAFRGFREQENLSVIEIFRRYYFSWQFQLFYFIIMIYVMNIFSRIINLRARIPNEFKKGEAKVFFPEIGYTYNACKSATVHAETWLLFTILLSYWMRISTARWRIMFSHVGYFVVLQAHVILLAIVVIILFRHKTEKINKFIYHTFPKDRYFHESHESCRQENMIFPMCNTLISQATFHEMGGQPSCASERYYCQQLGSTLAIFELLLFLTVFVQFCYDFGLTFRSLVSKNKSRFVDTLSEFDLDLSFITVDLIAMGVPVEYEPQALSLQHLWRNPAWEVRRFFDDGIPNTHYRIYNLCAEMPYSSGLFHDRVKAFDMQDHARPSMVQVFEALRDMDHFKSMDSRNILAIHCKAGKGRTGTLCCSWLLYSRTANSAVEALEIFAEKRTDHIKSKSGSAGKKKMIAVDTWAQVQCVHCVDAWLKATGAYQDTQIVALPPPALNMNIKSIQLQALLDIDPEEEANPLGELTCEIQSPAWDQGAGPIVGTCSAVADRAGFASFSFQDGAVVCQDFRISVYQERKRKAKGENFKRPNLKGSNIKERKKAGKEKGILFYVFGHTAFYSPDGHREHTHTELGDTKMMKQLHISHDAKMIVEYEMSDLSTLDPKAAQHVTNLRRSEFHSHLELIKNTVTRKLT